LTIAIQKLERRLIELQELSVQEAVLTVTKRRW